MTQDGRRSGRPKPQPYRHKLPRRCRAERHGFRINNSHKGYIHVGFHDDGDVGEIFITGAKEGSTISGLLDAVATLTSIALISVPLDDLVQKFSYTQFEPAGFTGDPDVPLAGARSPITSSASSALLGCRRYYRRRRRLAGVDDR